MVIVEFVMKIVAIAYVRGDEFPMDWHVFRLRHDERKKEIFKVKGQKPGAFIWIRDNTIDEEFSLHQISSGSASICRIMNFVTTDN